MRPAWTHRWLSAIPEGTDCSLALPRFLIRALDLLPETYRADVVASIKGVRDVLIAWRDTGAVDQAEAAEAAQEAAAACGLSLSQWMVSALTAELESPTEYPL